MTTPTDPRNPPMAEPGKRQTGADVGGMRANADAGLADASQRASERRDDDGAGRAATGGGSAGGTVSSGQQAGKPASSPAPASAPATAPGGSKPKPGWDDDDGPWRHAPVAPNDEDPLKSLGRSVSDVVTGSDPGQRDKPKA